MCMTMKPRRNEEAQAHIGLSSRTKKKKKNGTYGTRISAYLSCALQLAANPSGRAV
jgi:hypothetical protein